MPSRAQPLSSRLRSLVRQGGPDECWPFVGSTRGSTVPYGRLKVNGRTLSAHRLALELALGRPLRAGMLALHTCDLGLCCNPAHLYEGTHAENMRDRSERGRTRGAPRGERHHAAKLSDEAAAQLRARRLAGEPLAALADEFGVSPSRVSQLARAA